MQVAGNTSDALPGVLRGPDSTLTHLCKWLAATAGVYHLFPVNTPAPPLPPSLLITCLHCHPYLPLPGSAPAGMLRSARARCEELNQTQVVGSGDIWVRSVSRRVFLQQRGLSEEGQGLGFPSLCPWITDRVSRCLTPQGQSVSPGQGLVWRSIVSVFNSVYVPCSTALRFLIPLFTFCCSVSGFVFCCCCFFFSLCSVLLYCVYFSPCSALSCPSLVGLFVALVCSGMFSSAVSLFRCAFFGSA